MTRRTRDSKPALNHILRGILMPAAVTYGAGALARVLAYAGGIMPRYQSSVPVVSIGNLTVGGTGKTPVAIDLAKKFVAAGYKPAVLSRGYKRKSTEPYVIVSDGQTIRASCENSGDEPYLIALSVPSVAVIVGAKRAETAEIACRQLGCDLLILDDGFQHLGMKRDVDIVLIDYHDDIENDLLLPAGRLREPLASLARASSVVITKVPPEADRDKLEKISAIIHKYNPVASIGLLRFTASALVSLDELSSKLTLSSINGLDTLPTEVVAFCGLARPERFFDDLKSRHFSPKATLAFPDHHWYSHSDASKLNELAHKHKAEAFITTEKDLVKLVEVRSQLEFPVKAVGLVTQWISNIPPSVEELLEKELLNKDFSKKELL